MTTTVNNGSKHERVRSTPIPLQAYISESSPKQRQPLLLLPTVSLAHSHIHIAGSSLSSMTMHRRLTKLASFQRRRHTAHHTPRCQTTRAVRWTT